MHPLNKFVSNIFPDEVSLILFFLPLSRWIIYLSTHIMSGFLPQHHQIVLLVCLTCESWVLRCTCLAVIRMSFSLFWISKFSIVNFLKSLHYFIGLVTIQISICWCSSLVMIDLSIYGSLRMQHRTPFEFKNIWKLCKSTCNGAVLSSLLNYFACVCTQKMAKSVLLYSLAQLIHYFLSRHCNSKSHVLY